jgi:hypothetical protein
VPDVLSVFGIPHLPKLWLRNKDAHAHVSLAFQLRHCTRISLKLEDGGRLGKRDILLDYHGGQSKVEIDSLSAMTLKENLMKIEWVPEFVDSPNYLSAMMTGATLPLSNALCNQNPNLDSE